jgi:hypothetical protein
LMGVMEAHDSAIVVLLVFVVYSTTRASPITNRPSIIISSKTES